MKKPGQRGSPKTYLQKGEMVKCQGNGGKREWTKISTEVCPWSFLEVRRREKKLPVSRWEKAKLGNAPSAPFSYLRVPSIKTLCGGEQDPSPRRV